MMILLTQKCGEEESFILYSFIYLFLHSYTFHSFIHSFIHLLLFIYLFIFIIFFYITHSTLCVLATHNSVI